MIYYVAAFGLIFIGLYTVMAKKNLIKIIMGLTLIDTGVNIFLISIGYVNNGIPPIYLKGAPSGTMVDPVPQALVLTAIVIGVAVVGLALSLAIQLYRHYGTLNMRKVRDQKW